MGGITKYIIILDNKLLVPTDYRRSRTGFHGDDIYCMPEEEWKRAQIIKLEGSNSGRRSVEFINVPLEIRQLIEEAWLSGDSVLEVKRSLRRLLSLMR